MNAHPRQEHARTIPVDVINVKDRAGFPGAAHAADVPAASARSALPPAALPERRILWMRIDGLGDGVVSASMLAPIAAHYPGSRIAVVCRESAAMLYEHCPHVAEIIAFQHGRAIKDLQYRAQVLARIHSFQPDLCLYSAHFPEALADYFCTQSKARDIVALNGGPRYLTPARQARRMKEYTHLIPSPGLWKQELDRNGDFLRGLGIKPPDLAPVLWTAPEDASFVQNFLTQNGLDPAKTLVLFASAALDYQVYPHFGPVLADVCWQHGFSVVAIGDAAGAPVNQRCLQEAGVHSLNMCGKMTLRQNAELLRACRLAVGNGTDSAHLAWAVGTPHVIVLGGGQFGRFFPCSPLTSAVCLPLSCFGCNWRCTQTRAHCVKDIQPEVVEVALREALENPRKDPRLYMQHWSFVDAPAKTQPFFVADMLPQMLLDLAYVLPADAPELKNPVPALCGCPLRYIRVPSRARSRRAVARPT